MKSEDDEIRSARVETKSGGEGCYPITNLRYLEYHNEGTNVFDSKVINDQLTERSRRPKRQAALKAQNNFVVNCLFNYCNVN